jgi:hypothetical protein
MSLNLEESQVIDLGKKTRTTIFIGKTSNFYEGEVPSTLYNNDKTALGLPNYNCVAGTCYGVELEMDDHIFESITTLEFGSFLKLLSSIGGLHFLFTFILTIFIGMSIQCCYLLPEKIAKTIVRPFAIEETPEVPEVVYSELAQSEQVEESDK